MTPARSLLAGLCAGLVALWSIAAAAQSPPARPRPPPPPAPADVDNTLGDAANTLGGPDASGRAPGPPGSAPRAVLRPATPPAPVLRSAVQSRWSRPATIARSSEGQCRATCSVQRTSCAAGAISGGDTSGCDPAWTQCLSACAKLDYARGP